MSSVAVWLKTTVHYRIAYGRAATGANHHVTGGAKGQCKSGAERLDGLQTTEL